METNFKFESKDDVIKNERDSEVPVYIGKPSAARSLFVTCEEIRLTREFQTLWEVEQIVIIIMYLVLLFLSPWVFRYAMSSNVSDGINPGWATGLTFLDWLILVTLFVDTFFNFFRYLPALSGSPAELAATATVTCSGICSIGMSTPIVSENEILFLRSLLGRTATVFHTIGGRHDVEGCYIDAILNELRGENTGNQSMEKKRARIWAGWILFLVELANLDRSTLENNNVYEVYDANNESDATKLLRKLSIRQQSIMLPNATKDEENYSRLSHNPLDHVVTNTLYLSKGTAVQYEIDTTAIQFSGVQKVDIRSTASNHAAAFPRDQFNQAMKSKTGLVLNLKDILPLVCFIDGWLEEIKNKDFLIPYQSNKTEALKMSFNCAPCSKFFSGSALLQVQSLLQRLYQIFEDGDNVSFDDEDFKKFATFSRYSSFPEHNKSAFKSEMGRCPIYHQDEHLEMTWVIKRPNYGDWTIVWTYLSRARLPKNAKIVQDNPIVLESTRISVGTVVRIKHNKAHSVDAENANSDDLRAWFESREAENVMRVEAVSGAQVTCRPWLAGKSDTAGGVSMHSIDNVELVELNRGKAGSLNIFLDYLRLRTQRWVKETGVDVPSGSQVPVYNGIVDARHMLAEPAVFINEALPYFAKRKFDEKSHVKNPSDSQSFILVQYPQFFSNVFKDSDFLDNKNAAYYTLWQTLRDCSKTITSSGSNAVWDVSEPTFFFDTWSRVEDTGTSQNYLADRLTVHVPSFVANAIAKQTEDYVEAVYRWACGGVEVFWRTVFSWKVLELCKIAAIMAVYAMTCFANGLWAVLVWPALIVLLVGFDFLNQHVNGSMPWRWLNVAGTITLNTCGLVLNLTSPVWSIIVPLRLAFYGQYPNLDLPFDSSSQRLIVWALIALILRLPVALMIDRFIVISKTVQPKTDAGKAGHWVSRVDSWDYNLTLWRSSQLYLCAFPYSCLAIICGTYTGLRGIFFGGDNTMWSSFRSHASEINSAHQKLREASVCSVAFFAALFSYIYMNMQSIVESFQKPDFLTKWYATSIFLFNIACLIAGVFYVGPTEYIVTLALFVTVIINLSLTADVVNLMFSSFGAVINSFRRPEYYFALVGLVVAFIETSRQGSLFTYNLVSLSPTSLPPVNLCCATTNYTQKFLSQQCLPASAPNLGTVNSCDTCLIYQCVDWSAGSASMAVREELFFNQTGERVFLGVGSYGNDNSKAGLCVRMTVEGVDRDIIAQVVNQGSDVHEGSFDLQMGDGGFGIFDACVAPDTSVPMYPGDATVWNYRYGGASAVSECSGLPAYPICATTLAKKSPLIIENLTQLCETSFYLNLRTNYTANKRLAIRKACSVQCPEPLWRATGLHRSDELNQNFTCSSEFIFTDKGNLTSMMDCASPSYVYAVNVNGSTYPGHDRVVPCRRDGYTRITELPSLKLF